jgi:choline dehydrogenase
VRDRNAIQQAFIDAAVARGLPANDDFNGPDQEGVGWYQTTTRDGLRASTAVAYLHPAASRPNLTVETRVHALNIIFEGTRAVGVAGVRLDERLEFHAEREVILCAGAYGSPQLLMQSGIGRPDELERLGIWPVADLPGVGRNLQDHPFAGVVFLTDREDTLFDAFNEDNLELLLEHGRGPLSAPGLHAGGFARTDDRLDVPDVQLYCIPALVRDESLVPAHAPGVTVAACLIKPASTGYVTLVSPDPTAKPLIVHNYYAASEDLRTQVAGVRLCMEIAGTQPLAGCLGERYQYPASDSDADIAAMLRRRTASNLHPTSTCKLGVDELAVVDLELRVRGVDALRVVDASVMPSVPRGNTNAPTIAIAERAADLIRGRTPLGGEAAQAAASAGPS